MAPGVGFEPTTYRLTADGSAVELSWINWSGWRDLNPRPSGPKPDALPSCATPHQNSGTVSSPGRNRISQGHPLQRCGHTSGTYLKGQTVLATLLSTRMC